MSKAGYIAPQARVLLADDNEMNVKVALGLLEPLKMHIDVAANGREAYDMAKSTRYDLIYMDQMMPVMDGAAATKLIRELEEPSYESVPIVALSANALPDAYAKCRDCGMSDFLEKPFKPDEIIAMTCKWLPDELLQEAGTSQAGGSDGEAQIPEVAGLSSEEGIRYSGSLSMWLSLLSDYYNMMDVKSSLIRDCIRTGDIGRYTVEVHALKNTSRMIGASELSAEFYELERLGDARDVEAILKKTEGVLSHMESYKPALLPFAGRTEASEEVSRDKIREKLMAIHDAMDDFDLDGADEAMEELAGYSVPESMKSRIKRLRAYVADVAMEDVMRLTLELIEEL